jgi:hypothetical protein
MPAQGTPECGWLHAAVSQTAAVRNGFWRRSFHTLSFALCTARNRPIYHGDPARNAPCRGAAQWAARRCRAT